MILHWTLCSIVGKGQPRVLLHSMYVRSLVASCMYYVITLPTACQASPKPAPDTQPVQTIGCWYYPRSPISIPGRPSAAQRQRQPCAPAQVNGPMDVLCNASIRASSIAQATLSRLSPPSSVKATKLAAFAPQATSAAGTALLISSLQLLDALTYCCTDTPPFAEIARYVPV